MSHILGKVATAAAALSLAATPALAAQGSAASKLSLRAATASENGSSLEPGVIVGALALAAFSAGVIIVATNDDDEPDSP